MTFFNQGGCSAFKSEKFAPRPSSVCSKQATDSRSAPRYHMYCAKVAVASKMVARTATASPIVFMIESRTCI